MQTRSELKPCAKRGPDPLPGLKGITPAVPVKAAEQALTSAVGCGVVTYPKTSLPSHSPAPQSCRTYDEISEHIAKLLLTR